jgi:hypothetical protein
MGRRIVDCRGWTRSARGQGRRRTQAETVRADSPQMDAVLHWIANGLAGLFFIACVVAWWEHLGRSARYQPEDVATPKAPAKVDIALDDLPAPSGDSGERRSALVGAMTRMAAPAPRSTWIETAPMVLPPRSEEAAPPTPSQA